jgi:hypothetical protein
MKKLVLITAALIALCHPASAVDQRLLNVYGEYESVPGQLPLIIDASTADFGGHGICHHKNITIDSVDVLHITEICKYRSDTNTMNERWTLIQDDGRTYLIVVTDSPGKSIVLYRKIR